MLKLDFARQPGAPFRILCLGAHSDDIEIGCGGTLLKLLERIPEAEVWWVVCSAAGTRAREAQESAAAFLGAARHRVVLREFRDGFFPYLGADIKLFFEELKREFQPDLVFTHFRDDRHQDHRLVSDLSWNTFRDHLILEYEIPKYDGDLGCPNYFVQLEAAHCERKVANLLSCFGSQRDKRWFSADTFYALMRLRGIECHAPDRYAEAFYCRKLVS